MTGVNEVGFARTALAHRNLWFGRERMKGQENDEPLIPVWPRGHPQYEAAAMLQSLPKGKSYQWNLVMAPTPGELIHWMHKEM